MVSKINRKSARFLQERSFNGSSQNFLEKIQLKCVFLKKAEKCFIVNIILLTKKWKTARNTAKQHFNKNLKDTNMKKIFE